MSNEIHDLRKQAEIDADPRIDLAVELTELALERTHLAWVRTVVSLLVSGFALDQVFEVLQAERVSSEHAFIQHAHVVGLSLTILGTIIMLAETVYYYKRTRVLKQMRGASKSFFPSGLLVSVLMFVLGIIMIVILVEVSP